MRRKGDERGVASPLPVHSAVSRVMAAYFVVQVSSVCRLGLCHTWQEQYAALRSSAAARQTEACACLYSPTEPKQREQAKAIPKSLRQHIPPLPAAVEGQSPFMSDVLLDARG